MRFNETTQILNSHIVGARRGYSDFDHEKSGNRKQYIVQAQSSHRYTIVGIMKSQKIFQVIGFLEHAKCFRVRTHCVAAIVTVRGGNDTLKAVSQKRQRHYDA